MQESEGHTRTDVSVGEPVVFACSPRKGGNSDHCARAFAEGIQEAGGTCRMIFLRDHGVRPCLGCSACAATGECVLAGEDEAAMLFDLLMSAPFVMFSSPIYFYHLPALFKAFIDRGQSYYMRELNGDQLMAALPWREVYMGFCAGRPRGELLFEGSLLTMKYFLKIFHLSVHAHEGFRGMDGPLDFSRDHASVAAAQNLGKRAWKTYVRHNEGA